MEHKNYYELSIPAEIDKLPEILTFVDAMLEENGCSAKEQMQIDIALEELFVNIAHYAYPDSDGDATIRASILPGTVEITLMDSGIPYNPLEKPDPDVTLPAKDRAIGGLGIYMSKKLMDEVTYEYSDGKNIVTIKKLY